MDVEGIGLVDAIALNKGIGEEQLKAEIEQRGISNAIALNKGIGEEQLYTRISLK